MVSSHAGGGGPHCGLPPFFRRKAETLDTRGRMGMAYDTVSPTSIRKKKPGVSRKSAVTRSKTKRKMTFGEFVQRFVVSLPETNLSSREGFGN
jgi:hypothetical protein